jgi:hypothetical protein
MEKGLKTEAAPANKTDVPLLIITSSSRHLDKEEEQNYSDQSPKFQRREACPVFVCRWMPERAAAVCARAKRVR